MINKKIPIAVLLLPLALGIVIVVNQFNNSRENGRLVRAQVPGTPPSTTCLPTDDVCCSKHGEFFGNKTDCQTNNCIFIDNTLSTNECLSKRAWCHQKTTEEQCKNSGAMNACFTLYDVDGKFSGCNFEKLPENPLDGAFCLNQNPINDECRFGCEKVTSCEKKEGVILPAGKGCGVGHGDEYTIKKRCKEDYKAEYCQVNIKCRGIPTPGITHTKPPATENPPFTPPPPPIPPVEEPKPPIKPTPLPPKKPKHDQCELINDEKLCNGCRGENCIFCPVVDSKTCKEVKLCRYKKYDLETTCEPVSPPQTNVDLICDDTSSGTLISNTDELLDCLNHPKCKIVDMNTSFPRCVSVGEINLDYEKKENSCTYFFNNGTQESGNIGIELTLPFIIPSLKNVTVKIEEDEPPLANISGKTSFTCGIKTCKFTLVEKENQNSNCNAYNKEKVEGVGMKPVVTDEGNTTYCWNNPSCCAVIDSANYSRCVAKPNGNNEPICFLPNQDYCNKISDQETCSSDPLCCYKNSTGKCLKRGADILPDKNCTIQ